MDVPPLRQLRQLPPAPTTDASTRSAWNVRKGIIAAGLVLAALFAAASGLSWYTEPSLPKFDPVQRKQLIEERLASLSPAEGWQVWHEAYLPLAQTGLQEFQHRDEALIRQQVSQRRFFAITMLIPAGLFLVSAGLAAVWR